MPRPTFQSLDFSQFHPLDHLPGSRRCRDLPGGPRNHLSLAWEYRWKRELHAETLCRLGKHRMCDAWSQGRGDHRACWYCHRNG